MSYLKNCISIKIPEKNFYTTSNGYVYYQDGKNCYSQEYKQARPKPISVGKKDNTKESYFFPNSNYYKLFPAQKELLEVPNQSNCLSFGPHILFEKIISDNKLLDCLINAFSLDDEIDKRHYEYANLIIDLATYMLKEESSDIQHYPAHCFKSALFSSRVHSDSFITEFFKDEVNIDVRNRFLKIWSETQKAKQKDEPVYICYDSTNFNSTSLGITLVEKGYAKDIKEEPQFNLECVVRSKDGMPLMYSTYPGSVIDIKQCGKMIERLNEMGYKKIILVCDRGYISEENIRKIQGKGYGFILMVKDNLVMKKNIVELHGNEVRNYMDKYLPEYDVYADTFEDIIYRDIKVYHHLFYSQNITKKDREAFYTSISEMEEELFNLIKSKHEISTNKDFFLKHYCKYFDIEFNEKQGEKMTLKSYQKNQDKIRNAYENIGFWTIVSSDNNDCREILEQYKLRDRIEKTFMYIKTNFKMKKIGTHSNETTESKIFVAFIASIIRSVLVDKTRELRVKHNDNKSYTVKACLDELSKIEAYKSFDSIKYAPLYQITKKQNEILKQFDIDFEQVKSKILNYKM